MNENRKIDPQKRPLRVVKPTGMPKYTDSDIIEWE